MRIPVKRRAPGIQLYGGSGWCALHRDARNLVLDRGKTKRARRALRWALFPDEMFVQTVLANSPLRDHVVSDSLHYMDWSKPAPSPAVLTDAHWDDLVASPASFARKFEPDSPILDRIDRELLV